MWIIDLIKRCLRGYEFDSELLGLVIDENMD